MLDVALNNGRLIDPAAGIDKTASIGFQNGRVKIISDLPLNGRQVFDVRDRIVCPGFIDVHGHIDGHRYGGQLDLLQGITTTIGGNCGFSPSHVDQFLEQQNQNGFVINQAELVGESATLREAVGIIDPYVPADDRSIDLMSAIAREKLEKGAAGISLGLDYAPGSCQKELLAMARLCAEYHRLLAVHTRMTTCFDLNSLYELLNLAKETGTRLLISHYVYQYHAGGVRPGLEIIRTAREAGLDVYLDSGMYVSWTTGVHTATYDERNLHDNEMRFEDMVVATGEYTGCRMTREIYEKIRASREESSVIYLEGAENDPQVWECLMPAYAMPSTDSMEYRPGEGHPQIAGSFPRYLRQMVREQGLLDWPEAIRKATILPAQTARIRERGSLQPGWKADAVVFDPESIQDNARYPHLGRPDAVPGGIDCVFVNGRLAADHGQCTGETAGEVVFYTK